MFLKEVTPTKANTYHYEIDGNGNLISTYTNSPHRTRPKSTQQETAGRKRDNTSPFKFEPFAIMASQEELEPLKKEAPTSSVKCRCKKSHCTKYYCQCFSLGVACGASCACSQCQNTEDQKRRPRQKRKATAVGKVCFCTKSNCLKNYCACFSSGTGCKPSCKCANCKNMVIADMESHPSEHIRVELESPSEIKESLLNKQLQQPQGGSLALEKQLIVEEPAKEEEIWDYLINE